MGLIDLKTNLKSLQFVGETKSPSETVNAFLNNFKKNIYEPVPYLNKGYDGFNRGGVIDRGIHSAEDGVRFATFLSTTQNGLMFQIKEAGLQKMNPKLEFENSYRDYLVTTTAAQVLLGDLKSVYRHGVIVTSNNNRDKYFEYIKNSQIIPQDSSNNRLVKLFRNILVENPNEIIIDRYNGGGNSNLGAGETIIHRVVDSNRASTNNTWSRKTLDEYSSQLPVGTIREDFRKYIFPSKNGNYEKYNLKSRIGLDKSDDLQKLSIFYGRQNLEDSKYNRELVNNGKQVQKYNVESKKKETRDLVKFRIEIVDNNNPTHGNYLILRAVINNLSDNYSSNWNSISYNGRAESFYTYQSTERRITFSTSVVAQSKQELKKMYQKLNALAASMYPDYKEFKMRGTFIRLTVGDYLSSVYGFITDLNYTVPEDSTWEIALTEPEKGEDIDMYEVPKHIDVFFTFTPIHNFLPQNSLWRSKFILPLNDTSEASSKKWLTELKLLEENVKSNNNVEVAATTNTRTNNFTDFSLNSITNTSNYLNFLNGT